MWKLENKLISNVVYKYFVGEKDTPKEEATDSATSDQSNDSEVSFQLVTRK